MRGRGELRVRKRGAGAKIAEEGPEGQKERGQNLGERSLGVRTGGAVSAKGGDRETRGWGSEQGAQDSGERVGGTERGQEGCPRSGFVGLVVGQSWGWGWPW